MMRRVVQRGRSQMNQEFILALEELEKEKGISKDKLIDAIEQAIETACKKYADGNKGINVNVNIDRITGDIGIYTKKTVVAEENAVDYDNELTPDEAKAIGGNYEIGDVVEIKISPKDFGRIAAQTAKQVIVQQIREAERDKIFNEFSQRKGEIVTGVVHRVTSSKIFINIGNVEGILTQSEQTPGEFYTVGSYIKVYILDVKRGTKGTQIFLSRTHPDLVKRLFELEVPEIKEGVVEIKNISREPGSRSKLAVSTTDANIDAVGSCVGPRGTRVQAVVDELSGEKIDIINWSDDPASLIRSALSPAKVEYVFINDADNSATVVVPDFQLSLAIGKEGQNVRLAAKLCRWKIDIKSHTQFEEMGGEEAVMAEFDAIREELEREKAENTAAAGEYENEYGAEDDGIVEITYAEDGGEAEIAEESIEGADAESSDEVSVDEAADAESSDEVSADEGADAEDGIVFMD